MSRTPLTDKERKRLIFINRQPSLSRHSAPVVIVNQLMMTMMKQFMLAQHFLNHLTQILMVINIRVTQ